MAWTAPTSITTGNVIPEAFLDALRDNLMHLKVNITLEQNVELTIAAGVVTKTCSYHRVDTQDDDPTDDLDTINGGSEGDVLLIRAADGARTVVVKHGTGNVWNPTGDDITLDDEGDYVLLVFDSTNWCVIAGEASSLDIAAHIAAADPHTQYLLADGSRELTGDMAVTDTKKVDGRDLSVDGAKLDGVEAGADVTDADNVEAAGATMESYFYDYQGRKYRIFNPYVAKTNVYKGQLHCHSTESDGVDTPTEIVTAYKNAGYDFVCLTDHDNLTADPEVADILFIPGVEETSSLPTAHIGHINADAQLGKTSAQTIIESIIVETNALASLNHAVSYSSLRPDNYLNLEDLQLMEILSPNGSDEIPWVELLDSGKPIWCIAEDDCHDIGGANFNKYLVKVYADSCTITNIIDSLRNGNFYAMEVDGSTITDLSLSGNTISITVSDSSNIEWLGKGNRALQTDNAVTTASYTIKGNERYVRLRIKNVASSDYTFTQPIFISPIEGNYGDKSKLINTLDPRSLLMSRIFMPIITKSWETLDTWVVTTDGAGTFTAGWVYGALQTNTTANKNVSLKSPQSIYMAYITYGCFISMPIRFAQVTNQEIYLGLFTNPTAPTATEKHVCFKIVDNVIYASCADGATQTIEDTGVLAPTGPMRFAIDDNATSLDFYINGKLVKSFTTNRPVSFGAYTSYYIKTTAAENKALWVYPFNILPFYVF